jgi:diamine N-acetyltransferase
MLRGKRIVLRAARKKDAKCLVEFMNDGEVTLGICQYLPVSDIEEEAWLADMLIRRKDSDIFFVICLKNGKIIGSCGLHKVNHKDQNAELTVVIGKKDMWGKGYGVETGKLLIEYAFNQLNLQRLYTGAYAFNKKSLVFLKKLGFIREGRQRKAIYKNGGFHDTLLFGLLKEEYERT